MKQTISRAILSGLRGAGIAATRGATIVYIAIFPLLYWRNKIESIPPFNVSPLVIVLVAWGLSIIAYATFSAFAGAKQTSVPQDPIPTFWTIIRQAILMGATTTGWIIIGGCIIAYIGVILNPDNWLAAIIALLTAVSAPIVGVIVAVINAQIGFAYKETTESLQDRHEVEQI